MIDKNEVQKIVLQREKISIETQDHWGDGIQMCWDKFIEIFTADIHESIHFLENEATPKDIYWISEVFDDIADRTQSKEFLAALHRIHDKMPDDVKKSIEVDIQCAEDCFG